MRVLRLIIAAMVLPAVLTACQSSDSASSLYGGSLFNQPLDVQKQIDTLVGANKANSSAVKKPVATAENKAVPVKPEQAVETAASTPVNQEAVQVAALALRPADEMDPIAQQAIVALKKAEPKVEVEPIVKRKLSPQQRLAERRELYRPIVAKHARANGVPLELAMAVVEVESNYRRTAKGRAGEIGLMQLLPRTARFIGYEGEMKDLYHPDTNIRYGMKYLGKAHRLGGGTTCGTILKYNAGHAAKKMNRVSRYYCKRVREIMQQT